MSLSLIQDQASSRIILRWLRLTFLYFIIVALLGLFLRLLFFQPIRGVWFDNILHAHSHFAMLGWVFNLLFIGVLVAFIPEKIKKYRLMFWLAQIGALGMLFTFPFEGYAAMSISFTTLHVIVSWWFAGKFLRDIKGQKSLAHSLIRWALGFMIIANIGPFGLGAAMAQSGSSGELADLSLYYYLHFQYNGWFTIAVFALFFKLLQDNGIKINKQIKDYFTPLLAIASILGFTLSMLWLNVSWRIYLTGYLSAIAQVAALSILWQFLKSEKKRIKTILIPPAYRILQLAFLAFVIKVTLQLASAFPALADLAFEYKDLIIGYLHIVFIGFISFFLVAWLLQEKILFIRKKIAIQGMWIFLAGFILSELLIFGKPVVLMMHFSLIPTGLKVLFLVSVLMPLGIILFSLGSNLLQPAKKAEKQRTTSL